MKVGNWNKLPHYEVVGSPVDFYLFVNEGDGGSFSEWIKGKIAMDLYSELKKLHKSDKQKFADAVKKYCKEDPKQW